VRSYQHHIGDFNNATRHLDRIERSIYRDLIELYYDTEGPLPLDIPTICRRILARSNEESTVVERSLNEFFTQTPAGWYHGRCEAEIEKYRSSNSQRALAGKASAAKKAAKRQQALNGDSTSVEISLNETPTGNQNHKPVTSNHKPIKQHGADAPCLDHAEQFSELWSHWPTNYGEKGSRKNAEAAYLKLKPDKDLHERILAALDAQIVEKATKAAAGQFFSNFQHVERWIKNRRWEDEIGNTTLAAGGRISKSEQSAQAFEQYRQRLLAEAGDSGCDAGIAGDAVVVIPAGHH